MKRIALVACSIILLATAGCVAQYKTPGQNLDDTVIHTRVKSALVGLGSSQINIEVFQGHVQLAGFVASEALRQSAERQAAAVPGVRKVSNRLHLQPTPRSAGRTLDDGVIAGRVKAQLGENKSTSGIDINVEVREGVVLLSGFVKSQAEREEAVRVATAVQGVVDVLDGIDVIGN
jgi:hyperosmotically inducible periplasmic protein